MSCVVRIVAFSSAFHEVAGVVQKLETEANPQGYEQGRAHSYLFSLFIPVFFVCDGQRYKPLVDH